MILRNATLIDGSEREPVNHADVRLSDNTITEVGKNLSGTGEQEIDLSGLTLLPGLIDSHVHLCWDGSYDPAAVVQAQSEAEVVAQCVRAGLESLQHGVTTVRDVGSSYDAAIVTARAVREGWFPGPRTFTSGRTITMTGGHDPFWARFADGPQDAVKAVREQIYKGAHLIKVSATGGVYGRTEGEAAGQSELTFEEMEAIAREAHRFGLKVAAHAIGTEGVNDAVRAGIDTIEHGILASHETLEEMKRLNTALVPTLFIYESIAAGNAPAYAAKKAAEIVARHAETFQAARELNLTIGVGSDAGSTGAPHGALHDELDSMVNQGVTPWEAIQLTTRVNASILGQHRLGTIAPGQYADLIVIEGDPLSDIRALRNIQFVVADGKLHNGVNPQLAERLMPMAQR
jgi:imidazolonepropionase-like amidohydrolase